MVNYFLMGGCSFLGRNLIDRVVVLEPESNILVCDKQEFFDNLPSNKKIIKMTVQDLNNNINILNSDAVENYLIDFSDKVTNEISFEKAKESKEILFEKVINKYHFKKILYLSSSAVYGTERNHIVTEESELKPAGIYGFSKIFFENLYKNGIFGNNLVVARFFNTFGPYQRFQSGGSLITNLFFNAINNKSTDVIGDGQEIRDYMYSVSSANLFLKLLKTGEEVNVVNVGSGKGYATSQIIDQIQKIIKKQILVNYDLKNTNTDYSVADISKLNKLTGFNGEDLLLKLSDYYLWLTQ